MLIQFRFSNFRSFPSETVLSMVAERLAAKDSSLDENNTFAFDDKLRLLTSAAIYGPNASGKSNVVKALEFMQNRVVYSLVEAVTPQPTPGSRVSLRPFLLSSRTASEPSRFEVDFAADGVRYRYGFELSASRVDAEWLYYFPLGAQRLLFERSESEIKFGKDLRKAQRYRTFAQVFPNVLFLSLALVFKFETNATAWFEKLEIVSDLLDPQPDTYTRQSILTGNYVQEVKELVRHLDVGISDLKVKRKERPQAAQEGSPGKADTLAAAIEESDGELDAADIAVETVHKRYDAQGQIEGEEVFDLDGDESDGTKKLFALAGLLVEALNTGGVLVIDELDARLHTRLTREIVGLFNDKRANPRHAQLIFTTHDTNLLDNRLFRRDQIWFVQKDEWGGSQLYSLAEFKGVRNDKDFERGYMQGQYGALPFAHAIREAMIGTYGSTEAEPE